METVEMTKATSPFALTCAVFVVDQSARDQLVNAFRFTAGNLYINDKCTGSVVGQQPFGGARLSGTNDKAGFTSPMAVKETFVPLQTWKYPSMQPDK